MTISGPGKHLPPVIQYPVAVEVAVEYIPGTPMKLMSYVDKAITHIPVTIDANASPGDTVTAEFSLQYQTCDESTCYAPVTPLFSIPILVGRAIGGQTAENRELFEAISGDPIVSQSGTGCQPLAFNFFGRGFSMNPCGLGGISFLLLIAALGGFLLNLTPCVLPVLPLKIMGMSHAAGDPKRLIFPRCDDGHRCCGILDAHLWSDCLRGRLQRYLKFVPDRLVLTGRWSSLSRSWPSACSACLTSRCRSSSIS